MRFDPTRLRRAIRSAVLAAIACVGASAGAAQAAPTVVTLGFDNNYASQAINVVPLLGASGFKASFQINSCRVQGDLPPGMTIECPGGGRQPNGPEASYMTWDQIRAIYLLGHEIVGHSLHHRREASIEERGANICADRRNLLAAGFAVTSFAYPDTSTALDTALVEGCGYNSSRVSGGLRSPICPDCPVAGVLPPTMPFALKSTVVGHPTTADVLMKMVTDTATSGGGWVHYGFQSICEGCNVTPATLGEFLRRLRDEAPTGTVVATIDQVIGGTLQPPPAGGGGAGAPAPRPGSTIVAAARDTVRPRIVRLSLTRRTFRVKRLGRPAAARGTVIRYTLSEQPARVGVTFERRVGRRYVKVGSLNRRVGRLVNRLAFRGRVGARPLKPGRYRISMRAADGAGNLSAARRVTFRIRTG